MNTPWQAVGSFVCDADSIEVCEVKLWHDNPGEIAKLIAAAPELLAALEALVDAPFLTGQGALYVREVQAAEAAIAKARGEQA